jgi:alpha-glucosidase
MTTFAAIHLNTPYHMKSNERSISLIKQSLLCLALFSALPLSAETFLARNGNGGAMGEGVALFLPNDLSQERIPHSFALLQQPKSTKPLPEGWSVAPTFAFSETRTRATIAIPEGTSLYGTGEVTGPLLRNGTHVTLWNTDNYTYTIDEGKHLYESHPWVLAVRPNGTAFGVIADTTWRTDIDLEGSITFTSEGPSFPVVVIEKNTPQEVLHALAELTGHMPLPPRWALGYQQSRWSYNPDTKVKEIANEFRTRRIPCDVIWMDIDYMDGFRIFTFDKAQFPDPSGLNDYLHTKNFHTVWMIDPGVKIDPGYFVYDQGTSLDAWVHDAFGGTYEGSVWPGPCVFPDFTRPATRTWWSGLYKPFMAQGIDGVWNDMNEPAVFDIPAKTMPPHNFFRGGDNLEANTHQRYHNVYGMLMVQATREGIMTANPDKRPFVLSRANYLGGQRYAAVWTGDNASTWQHLRWSVPMTLNLGLSGQPFNGPDLGGFSGNATGDLWASWVSAGAFFPFARGHADKASNNKEPWAFGPEVEQVARVALERRYRILPYLYTIFRESSESGMPIMRPVFFADTHDLSLRAEDQAFLVGGDVLVIPRWANDPQIPQGWPAVSLVGEDPLNDPMQAIVRIRPGAIVPFGRIVQSTMEDSLKPLTLIIALDAEGKASGALYEDAGDGYGYKKGDYLLTTYSAVRSGDSVRVKVQSVEGKRARPEREMVVQIVGDGRILAQATGIDGKPLTVTLRGSN